MASQTRWLTFEAKIYCVAIENTYIHRVEFPYVYDVVPSAQGGLAFREYSELHVQYSKYLLQSKLTEQFELKEQPCYRTIFCDASTGVTIIINVVQNTLGNLNRLILGRLPCLHQQRTKLFSVAAIISLTAAFTDSTAKVWSQRTRTQQSLMQGSYGHT